MATRMNKESHTYIFWRNVGIHNLAVGMHGNFELRDLLKPHLSPALPHWKQTRVSAGQLDHNNNSRYADLSSPTYHQHYPALETDKSIGRSNMNACSE